MKSMEVIVIESETFKSLIKKIDEIEVKIEEAIKRPLLNDKWLDIKQTCEILKVSKRTLQTYRDRGVIGFSQFGGKIYINATDINKYLEKHYIKPTVNW